MYDYKINEVVDTRFLLPKGAYALPFIEYPTNTSYPRELWKELEPWMIGYTNHPIRENTYLISTYGRVYSRYFNKILSNRITKDGYVEVKLGKIYKRIHRLVMIAFCYHKDYMELEVDHIDCDKTNNHIWNLQWCTKRENIQYQYKRNYTNTYKFIRTNGKYIDDTEAKEIFLKLMKCTTSSEINFLAKQENVSYNWLLRLRNGDKKPIIREWYINNFGSIPEIDWRN